MSLFDDLNGDGGSQDREVGRLDQFMKRLFAAEEVAAEKTLEMPEPSAVGISPDTDLLNEIGEGPEALEPGERIGRFRIIECIGYGGFGVVYRAMDESNDSEVALKVPRNDRVTNPQVMRRFYREARLASSLEHPSIVRTLATGIEDGTFYIATEFVAGKNLRDWAASQDRPVDIRQVVEWGIELADALGYAFLNGIVHRDIKPTNILIPEKGATTESDDSPSIALVPKITDFGLAYSMKEPISSTSGSGLLVGTPSYMSPEQVLSGVSRVDIRADIYALGLIMAELLAGGPLRKFDHLMDLVMHFSKTDPARDLDILKNKIPVDLYCILLKCIEIDPNARYQTPGEFRDDLKCFRDGRATVARPMTRRERLVKLLRLNPYPAAIAILSLLFLGYFLVNRWMQDVALGEKNAELARKNNELESSNASLNETNARLQSTLEQLRGTEKNLVRQVYNSNMRLAYSEFRDGHVESAQDILDKTRRMKSQAGEPLPEFSWRYLSKLTREKHAGHHAGEFDAYLPGSRGLQMRRIYEANREFIDRNSFMYGELDITDDQAYFSSNWTQLQITDKFRAKYSGEETPGRWQYRDGEAVNPIDDKAMVTPTSGIRLSFIGGSLKLKQRGDLSSEFERRIQIRGSLDISLPYDHSRFVPVFSLNGRYTFGVVAFEIGGEKDYAWVGYDFQSRQVIDLGLRLLPSQLSERFVASPRMSESGSLLVFYNPEKQVVELFELGQKKSRPLINWSKYGTGALPVSLLIDEKRGRVFVGDSLSRIQAWNIGDESPFAEYPDRRQTLSDVGLLPGGLVSGRKAYLDRVWVWNPDEKPDPDRKFNLTDEVWSLVFNRDGNQLVGCGDDDRVHIWDLNTGEEKKLERHSSLVTSGRFSPDETMFAACDFSGWVKIWKTSDWSLVRNEKIATDKLRTLAWTPDNSAVLVGGNKTTALMPVSGEVRMISDSGERVRANFLYSALNRSFILSMEGSPSELVFLEWPGLKPGRSITVSKRTSRMALSPDEKQVAVGYVEGGFGVYDIATQKLVAEVDKEQSNGEVRSLIYLQDGRNLISAGGDNRMTIYETETWEPIGTIMDHGKRVHAMAVSADGGYFASGDMGGQIILRKVKP